MGVKLYLISVINLLGTEFSQMSSVSLLQPKDTICDQARDVVVCACGLPYSYLRVTVISKYPHASCKHILTQKIMLRWCCCCAIESSLRSVKSRFGFLAQTGQCNTKESVLQQLFLHISFRYVANGFTIYLLKFLSPKIFAEYMYPLTTTNLSFGCFSDT